MDLSDLADPSARKRKRKRDVGSVNRRVDSIGDVLSAMFANDRHFEAYDPAVGEEELDAETEQLLENDLLEKKAKARLKKKIEAEKKRARDDGQEAKMQNALKATTRRDEALRKKFKRRPRAVKRFSSVVQRASSSSSPPTIEDSKAEGIDDPDCEVVFRKDDALNPIQYQHAYYLAGDDPSLVGLRTDRRSKEELLPRDFDFCANADLWQRNSGTGSMIIDKVKALGAKGSTLTRPALARNALQRHDLISKKQARELLRVKYHPHERDCVRGQRCQAYIWERDVLRECLSNEEEAHRVQTDQLPETPRRCLRCKRYDVQKDFTNALSECSGVPCNVLLSDFYVAPDVLGEYIMEQCLQSSVVDFQGLPRPVPIESGRFYHRWVEPVSGMIYHFEEGLMTPEEFAALNPAIHLGFP